MRYRGTYLLEHLKKEHYIRYHHFIPYRTAFSLLRLLSLLLVLRIGRKNHLIVIQRVSSFGFYGKSLQRLIQKTRHKHHFIYDLDDAIYEEMESDAQICWFMKHVHQVYVGSEELKEYALKQNLHVTVLTTPVIPDERNAVFKFKDGLRLGFIGCYWGTHFQNMRDLVFPSLKELPFSVELVIIGANKEQERLETITYFTGLPHVQVVFREISNWMDEREINKAMLDWDLGLAPLKNTVVCRAKSAFKVKQYLNLGIPVISTRVGENSRFVRHAENGFFFDSTDELCEILQQFQAKSKDERNALSRQAKASVEAFSLNAVAISWLDGLRDQ